MNDELTINSHWSRNAFVRSRWYDTRILPSDIVLVVGFGYLIWHNSDYRFLNLAFAIVAIGFFRLFVIPIVQWSGFRDLPSAPVWQITELGIQSTIGEKSTMETWANYRSARETKRFYVLKRVRHQPHLAFGKNAFRSGADEEMFKLIVRSHLRTNFPH